MVTVQNSCKGMATNTEIKEGNAGTVFPYKIMKAQQRRETIKPVLETAFWHLLHKLCF